MAKTEKTNHYLLSIVGIVAVVAVGGIILLVSNVRKAPTYLNEEETLVGEAIISKPRTILPSDLDVYEFKVVHIMDRAPTETELGLPELPELMKDYDFLRIVSYIKSKNVKLRSQSYNNTINVTYTKPDGTAETLTKTIEQSGDDPELEAVLPVLEENIKDVLLAGETVDVDITIQLDSDNSIKEANEDNNLYSRTETLTSDKALPDINLQEITVQYLFDPEKNVFTDTTDDFRVVVIINNDGYDIIPAGTNFETSIIITYTDKSGEEITLVPISETTTLTEDFWGCHIGECGSRWIEFENLQKSITFPKDLLIQIRNGQMDNFKITAIVDDPDEVLESSDTNNRGTETGYFSEEEFVTEHWSY